MPNESIKNVAQRHSTFRFAHLSDLHISSPGAPLPWQIANKRILGYLSWLRKRRHTHQISIANLAIKQLQQSNIDHYVITGDLTHIGLQNEFRQTASWLKSIGSGENITVIPGNHDLYVNEKWACSFAQWESYLQADTPPSLGSSSASDALSRLENLYPVLRIRGNTVFICVSSIFNAPWFRATGRVNDNQLQRLKKVLTDSTLDQYCKVLLIHHPITLTHTRARKSLLNNKEVLDVIRQSPAHLVLHGHGHQSTYEQLSSHSNEQIAVIGASSSSSNSQKNHRKAEYLIIEVNDAQQNWEISIDRYSLNTTQGSFKKDTQQSLSFSKKT